ncbi:MAG TPA: hypothetical protein VNZ43_15345 [Sphingomonadaceae bacterium]|nr:hypothetical protein [Sphingomonadaceae bacterium]
MDTPAEQHLLTFIESYIAALAAHDPSRLPLASGARYTENTNEIAFGQGLWGTFSGLGDYDIRVADPARNAVCLLASITEHEAPAIFALRLRIEADRIVEAEALVARGRAGAETMGVADPVFTTEVPPEQRTPQADMIALVDRYFDGVEQSDAFDLRFHPDCVRRENGSQSTSIPDRTEDFVAGRFHGYALDIRAQFATRMWSFIERVSPRRYVIANERTGVVVGFFGFQHPGAITHFIAPTGDRVPMPPYALAPSTFEIAEIFKFEAGAFRRIEAIGVILPFGQHPGWPAPQHGRTT